MKQSYPKIRWMLMALFMLVGINAWADEVTDKLDQSVTGVTGTNYATFSDKTVSSDAVYAGQCAGGNESIQLRTNKNNSGVVTTTSGGTAKKIVVTWNENTDAARTLSIYGSNNAYAAATELYNTETQGTLIGELTCSEAIDGVSTLEIEDAYKYIGFRSKNGALYLTSVDITWETGTSVTIVARPTLPSSTTFFGSTTVEITAEEGADIHYTLDGTEPTAASTAYTEALTITETTTVKAIAVVNGTASNVASATYTAIEQQTLAEAQATDNGTTVCVEATVVASAANGAVLYDGTDYLYYYNTSNALAVGQKVRMIGALATYGGAKQLTYTATITELGTETVTHPAATTLGGADFDEIQAAKVVSTRQFVSFIGTLSISGNYFNITVDGAETAVGSIVKPSEDLSELNGKTVEVQGYLMYVSGKYVYAVVTSVEALKTELDNADFSAATIIDNHICTYAKDMETNGTTFSQMQEVADWTIANNGDARAAGVMAYGSDKWIGGAGYPVPAFNPAGVAEGQGLGIVAVWSADAQYTQETTLSAGYYLVSARINNVGGTTATDSNLFGATVGESSYFAENKTYEIGVWTRENVTFQVEEAANAVISLGYKSTNAGNAAQQHLFYDGIIVKAFKTEEARTAYLEELATADAADAEAYAAAQAALALADAREKALAAIDALLVGDGLFQYSQDAIDAAKKVVAAAESLEDIEAAMPAPNAPDAEKQYSFQLKDGGMYMTINDGIKLAEQAMGFTFEAVEGGYALKNESSYVAFTGTGNNTWTMNASEAPYAWVVNALADGYYTIAKAANSAHLIGVDNTGIGSSCYANKGVSDKALWTIAEYTESEPEPEPEPLKPGDDATALITNPSFETGDLTGWTVGSSSDTGVKPNSNATYTAEGCDGDYLFNTWWQGIPITQTVKGLPNGLYELKALMTSDPGDHLYLLANDQHSEVFGSPNGKEVFVEQSMQFYVTDGTATIGAIGGNDDGSFNEAGYFWYKVDNFRLTYLAALPDIADIKIPEGKMSNEAAAAIAAAQEAENVIALIEAVKAAEQSIAAYADAAAAIEAAKTLMESTNVYTPEAFEAYANIYKEAETKYNEGTLTDAEAAALENPLLITQWQHDASRVSDDLLLSAWSIGDAKAKDFETSLYINTWSVEGETDGSEFKVPFYEYWTGDDNSLGETVISATIESLEAGTYDVSVWVRVRAKNGTSAADATGITLQVNDGKATDVADGGTVDGSQFNIAEYKATGVVGNDGKLTIKFIVASDNNISWLSFKNVNYKKSDSNAISNLAATTQNGRIYNIVGQQTGKLQKGVNIVGGKKIIVK